MKQIIEFCLKNSLLLNLITLATIVAGIIAALETHREAFPGVDFDTLTVRTVYPGASPKEVELQVTNPLEEEIENVEGIEEFYSHSIENVSLIVIKLNPELSSEDKNKTVNQIHSAVDLVKDLPKTLPYPPDVTQLDSGALPIMELGLTGPMSYDQLHRIAQEIQERIKKLPDAKSPIAYGFKKREFWLEVDPRKMKNFHVGLLEVMATLANKNLNLPGGVLKTPQGDLLIRTIGEIKTAEEIDQVILRTNSSGSKLRIRDIGHTSAAFEENLESFRTNGKASINLIIRKKPNGDIVNLVNDIRGLIKELKQKPEYSELQASFVNDMSVFVKNRLGVLINNGIMGMILVMVALLLFLSRGIALVAALGMPVALLGAILVMQWMGITINLLSLFALVIVLGMLVDDAIIVAENIWQHYEQGKSPWDAAIDGTKEVFLPVTATILTSIAAFSPLLMIYGIFGKFLESLPKVVMISLVISLIEAMFILPSHAYEMLRFNHHRRKQKNKDKLEPIKKESGLMESCLRIYERILYFTLKARYLALALILGTLLATFYLQNSFMKVILFPNEGLEFFFVRLDYASGATIEETEAKLVPFEKYIRNKLPASELKDLVTYSGLQQVDHMDPLKARASHVGQVGVYLSPESDRSRTVDEVIQAIRPDIEALASQQNAQRVYFSRQRIGPPVGKPVAIRIYGDQFEVMNMAASEISTILAKQSGISDISEDFLPGKDELQIRVIEEEASRSFLSTRDIGSRIRAFIEGEVASHIHQNGEKIPLRIKLLEKSTADLADLKQSVIMNKLGNLVPLDQIAQFHQSKGISSIKHRNGSRVITITAALDESLISSNEINKSMGPPLLALNKKYPQLTFERGGEYEDTSKSMKSLSYAFLSAAVMIFIILAAQFKSLTQPFVVMMAIPFGIIGVILSFYFHQLPLSFLALIGVIGLSGVVVNDSIVLVDFINKARQRDMTSFEATLYAGKRRFRAVWLTSVTTILGLLPLVYGVGGQDAFLKPAAMALAYGLMFSTVLILLIVPALYLIRKDLLNLFIAALNPLGKVFNIQLKKIS
ncbi:MAG: efflux RND transporter permease subunit [Oligoflexales bacterium]